MLRALLSLEAERGRKSFYVWAIVERAWELSPDLRQRHQDNLDRSAASHAQLQRDADEGDTVARELITLGSIIRSWRRRPRRMQRRQFPSIVEEALNPSRTLLSLASRGLVIRNALRGGGYAGLTALGRDEARRWLVRMLAGHGSK
jgi:hypothetical protein